MQDTTHLAWKSVYHPSPESVPSAAISTSASITESVSVSASVITTLKLLPCSEEVLNELLVLSQLLPAKTGQRKKAINNKAKKITDAVILQEMNKKKQAAADAKK